jgi:predicted dithiol-disulfide oxidoreductase (DUF899 family)
MEGTMLDKPAKNPRIVSRDEWLAARKAHLKNEKALTRLRDLVSAERRSLPWVRVDKDYVFETPEGKKSLAELFGRNSQLIVYHFMFGPDWEAGCPSCSFLADHFDGPNQHLAHHDVTLMAITRVPVEKFAAYAKRLGWRFDWAPSFGNDFNFDYGVSFTKEQLAGNVEYNCRTIEGKDAFDELPGVSVFYKDPTGAVFHTYSSYARGLDVLVGAHNFLDLTPKGRNETQIMDWVRRHDEYDGAKTKSCCD